MKHRLVYVAPAVLAAVAMAGCASTGTIDPATAGSSTSPSSTTTPGPPYAGGSADRSDAQKTTGPDDKPGSDAKSGNKKSGSEKSDAAKSEGDNRHDDSNRTDGKQPDGSAAKDSNDRSDDAQKDAAQKDAAQKDEDKSSAAKKQETHKTDSDTSDSGESEKHASDPLSFGDSGPRVAKLQERLESLGYWVSGTDGNFGPTTRQAVYAIQKVAGLSRDGVAGANTNKAIESGARPTPHSTSGHVVEVDLKRQIVMVVDGGHVDTVLNTSTASGKHYTSEGRRYLAVTPTGKFTVSRQINGTRHSKLGYLWRPKYFNGGIALHGEKTNVPPYPVSHGCVRVTNAAMNWIWKTDQVPVGTAVWVY